MKRSKICLLLLAILACRNVKAQSEDELTIPFESDNQFPPDNHSETAGLEIEGSGEGLVEDPTDHTTTEFNTAPKLEEVESTAVAHSEVISPVDNKDACPNPCVCSTEGGTNDFVVDCSGYGLTEFPSPLDPKTTKLKLQKNKLTEIPKEVSLLKNLKELNVNDNSVMEIASGSISELPELLVLKLGNNRLIEYPKDLKNSLSLTKLQELDLGGNDMRTTLSHQIFSGFSNLRKVTLPTSTSELVQDLCIHLKDTLETVCTGSCEKESFECPDAPPNFDEDLLEATLPGMIPVDTLEEDKENADPSVNISGGERSIKEEPVNVTPTSSSVESTPIHNNKIAGVNELLRHSENNNEEVKIAPSNTIVNITKDESTSNQDDVKIGAKTTETKSGGVDRSLIAIIVASMVVVVAGVTIKKNWNSIKKRFSSTPRSPNERQGGNANGTSPEEVPLQDKSPA